jgi:hypothetical protein
MEDRDAPTAGIRVYWRDVRAWCAECDWEVATTADSYPSANDARRDARGHVLATGHGVNVSVHDFYAPPREGS